MEDTGMKSLKYTIGKAVQGFLARTVGNELAQEEYVVQGEATVFPGMPEILRECGGESIVLLKNENHALPLTSEDRVAVFGRCQNDWFYVGYGSGGDVNLPYRVSLMDGLRNAGIRVYTPLAQTYATWCAKPEHQADHGWWGHWPFYYEEMPLQEEQVREAAANTDAAIVAIGRAAGEDRENALEAGSYYLTQDEHTLLKQVTKAFSRVVVLMNCGNIMDLSFVRQYPVSALVYVWQLGMESGNAVADVLTGKVNPSGKLSDTIALSYADYPSAGSFGGKHFNNYEEDIFVGYRYFETFGREKVLYPFGYGLSYTSFSMEALSFAREVGGAKVQVKVKNTGAVSGKEVVQIYCAAPAGCLSKPGKVLAAYAKTKLLAPGEEEVLDFAIRDKEIASFDDSGATGFANAFVLEKGRYTFFFGNCSTSDSVAGGFDLEKTYAVAQCREACGPQEAFRVLTNSGMSLVTMGARDLKQRILDHIPETIPYTGDKGIKLFDVVEGSATLEEFVAQLSDRDLADLTRGEGPMNSKLSEVGNAGAFAGITDSLRAKGIPPVITSDGPSGLRVRRFASLLPCGTAIACSWNDRLTERVYAAMGQEAAQFGIDVILAPGMNIHRNPLCGRNFEYYSEDPLLCGKTAAAAVRGIQSSDVSACPKHFACNNQEVNRNKNDSRVSMRALREIYLKCFEICVNEAAPQNIMTSYNKINGVWSHYNYDLIATILRGEWGYRGNVMTDWWMQMAPSPEFPIVRNNAYRVRAQVDLLMPGGASFAKQKYIFDAEQLETLDMDGGLTRGELQLCAMNVLRFAMLRMKAKQ